MKKTLGTLAAIAACTSIAAPAQAGAVFNDPTGDTAAQNRIVHQLDNMIRATPKGATVRLAVMTLSIPEVADALIAAHGHGANVRVVLPVSKRDQPQATRLRHELGSNPRAGSWIRFCTGSCYRAGTHSGVMHAKIATFSRTGSHRYATWTSSGNLDASHTRDKYNDAYSTFGNRTLYRAGTSYVERMKVDNYDHVPAPVSSGSLGMHFFPRGGNVYLSVLRDVHCSGGATVRMATSLWDSTRADVARRLVALRKAGCSVRVLIQSYRTSSKITHILHAGRVPTRRADHDGHGNHSKALAISGHFRGSRHANVVYAGSLNLTLGDGGCDNNMVRAAAFGPYSRAFGRQWGRAPQVTAKTVAMNVTVSPAEAAQD